MGAMREMPRYQSHKKVWALKIAQIEHLPNPDITGMSAAASYGAIITPVEDGYAPFPVSAEYVIKHKPQEGGYFVQYEGGYKSYSPAEAFEGGYTPIRHGVADMAQPTYSIGSAPKVTLQDIEANIASEHYFTAAEGASGVVDDDMVNRFLTWPVPPGVYPDGVPGKPGRIGTNLLSATEAREMLQHVVAAPAVPPSLGLLTFCVLVLRNGTKIVGINYGPVSPENFNAEQGRQEARKHAIEQVWPLLGYELRSKLAAKQ